MIKKPYEIFPSFSPAALYSSLVLGLSSQVPVNDLPWDNDCFHKQGHAYRSYPMWGSKSENTGVELAFGKLQATELNSMTTLMSQKCYMDLSF
jgi:hypothetical protein